MYLMYLDEAGTSRLSEETRPQGDFFLLGGLIIKEEHFLKVDADFKSLKRSLLPDSVASLPIHAVELNQIGLKRRDPNRYAGVLAPEDGRRILVELYEFIAACPIEAIAVIVDNYELKRQYKFPDSPYLFSYSAILERFQQIVEGRSDPTNQLGMVHVAECAKSLTIAIEDLHARLLRDGTIYVKDFSRIVGRVSVEPQEKSSFYEIADLICYAFQRQYYFWLCDNLGLKNFDEKYLDIIKPICTLKIGKVLMNGSVKVKVFPKPRFLSKEEIKVKT